MDTLSARANLGGAEKVPSVIRGGGEISESSMSQQRRSEADRSLPVFHDDLASSVSAATSQKGQ